jgi:Pectate lyase superfamily protein
MTVPYIFANASQSIPLSELDANFSALESASNIIYTTPNTTDTRTVNSKLSDIVSIKDFGAVGNGVDDDTTAIQNAINFVETNGGGSVYVPSGIYKITSSLIISGATSLNLFGTWSSIIENKGTTDSIQIGNLTADQTNDVRISGIQIQGQSGTGNGIYIMRMHNMFVEKCRVLNHGSNGIRLDGCYGTNILYSYINNNSGHGIYLYGLGTTVTTGYGCDFVQVIRSAILANGGAGIYNDCTNYGPAGQRFERNDFEGNAQGFVAICGSAANNVEGMYLGRNYFENQVGANIVIGNDSGTTIFDNPIIDSNFINTGPNGQAVVNITIGAKCKYFSFTNNTIVGCDLIIVSGAVLGSFVGNRINTTPPVGYDSAGGVSTENLHLIQDSSNAALIGMSGGVAYVNQAWQTGGQVYPPSANNGATQSSYGIWAGSGAPSNSYGNNGDYYFRGDTPSTSNQRIYIKNSSGFWVSLI